VGSFVCGWAPGKSWGRGIIVVWSLVRCIVVTTCLCLFVDMPVSKFMGVGAMVSCKLKSSSHHETWKQKYPSQDWRDIREVFAVTGRRDIIDNASYTLLLAHKDYEEREFKAMSGSVKLEKKGPPNQIFATTDTPPQARSTPHQVGPALPPGSLPQSVPMPASTANTAASSAEANANESDPESCDDNEDDDIRPPPPDQDTVEINHTATVESDHTVTSNRLGMWDDPVDSKPINARTIDKQKAGLSNHPNTSGMHEFDFFDVMLPDFVTTVIVQETSKVLTDSGEHPLTKGEFMRWIGMWLIIGLHPCVDRIHFWRQSEPPSDLDCKPPYLGKFMSRNRFNNILSALKTNGPPTADNRNDKFWMIRGMLNAFNENMHENFFSSWLICGDESMMAFYNTLIAGFMAVMRKPHRFGNELHTVCCALTRIMFHIEIVEGKDRPPDGPYSTVEFNELGKTPGLVLRMTKSVHGSGRVVILDSGFGAPKTAKALLEKGVYSTAVIKKKRYWPAGVPGDAIKDDMHGEPIGKQKVYNGKDGTDCEGLWLGAMADSKHTSIMCNSWATTQEMGRMKKRRVGLGLEEFHYAEYQHFYYMGRNAVDAHNQNRQGFLSIEDIAGTKNWAKRMFFFLLGVVEVNALLGFNHFVREKTGSDKVSKATFRRNLAEKLIHNPDIMYDDWYNDSDNDCQAQYDVRSRSIHKLTKLRPYRGRFKNGSFPAIKSQYPKYNCHICSRPIRTYCSCDRSTMVCANCHHVHIE
jgi:hypothetical protein